jgi:HK97 family phage major capsid protein
MSNLIEELRARRLNAWEHAKSINEASIAESRDGSFSGEEQAAWEKANADIDQLDARIASLIDQEQRDVAAANALGAIGQRPTAPTPVRDESTELRSWLRGEGGKTFEIERRDVTKGSTGAPVPTSFYDQLTVHMVQVGPMLELGTIVNTASGENMQFPRTATFSTSAITSEGSAISESDPTFSAFVTLGAYKYSHLVQVSREMIEDQGVDVIGFLAENTGVSLGVKINTDLTVGTGSSQPRGLTLDTTLGVTGGSGVTGAFTADNLIDLAYSVNQAYRRLPSCAWQMRDSSIAAVRKLKDSQNRYLFEPNMQAGQPDLLLGYPLYSNPDVAATALSAKSVVFGAMSKYIVRQVGAVRLDRSDEFAFSSDLITFRATSRVDGALVDTTGAVKHFIGNAA